MPWEDWSDLDLIADKTSQWVRATSPSGDADYVGRVAWSGEIGFGVKAPELGQTADDVPTETPEPAADHDHDHAHGGGHHCWSSSSSSSRARPAWPAMQDVVKGRRGAVCVAAGGCRIIKKKKHHNHTII